MTLLLIVPAWILLLALATALCMAARAGDAGQSREASSGDLAELLIREPSMPDGELTLIAPGRARSHSPRTDASDASKPAEVEIAA